jgi:hypothetical protein
LDVVGNRVLSRFGEGPGELGLSGLRPGVYFVKVTVPEFTKVRRICIQ